MSRQKLGMVFLVIFLVFSCAALQAEVVCIDLSLAVSLHPRMALFDFDRMGFFKIPMGLTESEFNAERQRLRRSLPAPEILEEETELRQALSELESQKAAIFSQFSGLTREKGLELQSQFDEIAAREEEIRNRLSDIRYIKECTDLTPPDETRKILSQIEQDIIRTVARVARDNSYSVVLNSSMPSSAGYPVNYRSGESYGYGVPGIDQALFYSFLSLKQEDGIPVAMPESRKMINWLELTRFPPAIDLLPVRPWPLVLSGARSILREVMERVYNEHKVEPKVWQVVNSVLEMVEQNSTIDLSESLGH